MRLCGTSSGVVLSETQLGNMALRAKQQRAFRPGSERVKKAYSQTELNKLYLGPKFPIAIRYAQLLNLFFVSFVYASGMPILYPMCMIGMLVSYWVDKILPVDLYGCLLRRCCVC